MRPSLQTLALLRRQGAAALAATRGAGGGVVASTASSQAAAQEIFSVQLSSLPTWPPQHAGFSISAAAQAEEATTTSAPEQSDFLDTIKGKYGPAALYKERRLSKLYSKDARQEATIAQLQLLYDGLAKVYKPKRRSGLTVMDHVEHKPTQQHWWQGWGSHAAPAPEGPKGLYMYGGVGVGKTMLMDLLVKAAPAEFKLKRIHYHDFMLDVHKRLQGKKSADPLSQVAGAIMGEIKVLCLDEVFVTDVADAAIMNRLFGHMWDQGLVLVSTSNRKPTSLYERGLQRDLFLPFIGRLQERCVVHDMESTTDYRRRSHYRRGLWFTTGSQQEPSKELAARFEEVTKAAGATAEHQTIEVMMGRKLDIPQAGGGACLMRFEELCGRPVAAADYIALATKFHTLALDGIPVFTGATRSEAYRFVTLVDVLYDHHVRLFASAAAPPAQLFDNIYTLEVAHKQDLGESAIIDDELAFANDRTQSRLQEMQSAQYLADHAKEHVPHTYPALQEAVERQGKPADSEVMAMQLQQKSRGQPSDAS